MTPAEFAKEMRKVVYLHRNDPDIAIWKGEDLMVQALRSLGYGKGCDAFEWIDLMVAKQGQPD